MTAENARTESLDLDLGLRDFLREVVDDTLRGSNTRPEPLIQEYLLGLLEDSACGKGLVRETLASPLAVQLSEALHAPAAERFHRLRKLGDGVLLLGGLYEPHLRHTGLPDRYVIALGQKAYSSASQVMVVGPSTPIVGEEPVDLLARLAEGFTQFIALLRDISDTLIARSANNARDLTKLWERWVEKKSDHLGRLLAGRGIPVSSVTGALN